MDEGEKINIYGTRAFTSKFMPLVEQNNSIRYDYDRFLIMRIEEMYPHVAHRVPPARSLNDIILFINAGEAQMNIGTECYVAVKNTLLYIPSGQIFSFEPYDNSKYTNGFLITFSKDVLPADQDNTGIFTASGLLNFSGSPFISVEEESFSFATQLLERILQENNENGLTRIEIIRSYFFAFLLEIRKKNTDHTVLKKSASIKLVKDFIAMVTLHVKTKKKVSDYASLLHISPNHLSKVMKKFTNKSPAKWIDETLVLEAKVLLFQTNMSINEIAFFLGIFDPSYFSRLFKKQEGISPLSFRNEIRRIN
jgi:AraC family transcriptional activator of pobA